MPDTESRSIPMWIWLACSEQYLEQGWEVRGYELVGPLSTPTRVEIERKKENIPFTEIVEFKEVIK